MGSPSEGCPSSQCLLHGPDQPPGIAPGLRPEAGFYLAAKAPSYPTTHSTAHRGFYYLHQRHLRKPGHLILGESEPRRKCTCSPYRAVLCTLKSDLRTFGPFPFSLREKKLSFGFWLLLFNSCISLFSIPSLWLRYNLATRIFF